MNSAKRVGSGEVWGLRKASRKELRTRKNCPPHHRQTGQGAGDGLSSRSSCWGGRGGVREAVYLGAAQVLVDTAQGGLSYQAKGPPVA